jgi:hypothetical protein
MKNVALKILKALERESELSLEEIRNLLPARFNDHRDFYVFASLVAQDFIAEPTLPNPDADPKFFARTEQLLARKYFACSTAEKRVTYENRSWTIAGEGETLKGQKFALSGKGYLYLREARTKRFDRAFTIVAGMLIGVIVALCSVLIQRYMPPPDVHGGAPSAESIDH